MKSIITIFILVFSANIVTGQYCHSMAKASGCCSKSASAALVAADQSGIQVRKDVATGDLSFHRRTSCAYSDHASYVEVRFDANTNSFVNRAPEFSSDPQALPVSIQSPSMKKMDCSQMSKAECAEKMAKGECQTKPKA